MIASVPPELESLKVTGERLIPDAQAHELVAAEHLARYRWAARLARDRRVLDAACGEGYGTAMLRDAGAREAAGVDVDAETVEHARSRYGLDIRCADIAKLPWADGAFDLVVSFETIEHVEDAPRAVAELRRVLADDGVLVVSTPNPAEYVLDNEFHTREYLPDELDAILAPHFPVRRRLFQHNWLMSAVMDEDDAAESGASRPLDLELYKTFAREPGRELYSLWVCGELDALPRGTGVMTDVYEAHRIVAESSGWRDRALLAESDSAPYRSRAEEAERLLRAWEERAGEAERQLAEARASLALVHSSLSWRLTRPLRSAKRRLGRGR
jgi:SAM-dependent methyltransferase